MADLQIYNEDRSSLIEWLQAQQQPAFRVKQLWEGLYKQLYSDFSQFANIPNSLKADLAAQFTLMPLTLIESIHSKDNLTEKVLFQLQDGARVETVLMRYEERNSVCVSTQVGCPMGCVFCATGQMGYQRNLSAAEILGQVIYFMARLRSEGQNLTNVVYMGMGEPFLNFDSVMKSIARLTDPEGLNFGARRITISTVGIIPKIERFAAENSQVNLAVSLHSADNALRSQLVPANKIYPLNALMKTCRQYVQTTHRRLTFEYALINEVNDSPEMAEQLAQLLTGLLCHVNLIALNPSKEYPLQGSPRERVNQFREILERHGINATIRLRRGVEIHAGCGQLASSRAAE